jgi:hypothetical protein
MLTETLLNQKIAKKNHEIQALEEKVKGARAYLQALLDLKKEIGRSDAESEPGDVTVKSGSIIDLAKEAIILADRPLTLDEIISAIGREPTRESRASVSGSLSAYVRRDEVFTRPAPSVFGLKELGHDRSTEQPEPPVGFGGQDTSELDDDIPF